MPVRASRVAQLIAWYVALLLPTLYVKYRLMLVLARWWVEGSSTDSLSDGEITSSASLWLGHVAPADVLEVAVIVLILWLVGHVVSRLAVSWLATVSVALALVFLGITLLALSETGALVTWDALRTAGNWVRQDDRVLDLSVRQGLIAAAAAVWVAAPVAFAWLLARVERSMPRLRQLAPALVLAILIASAIARPDVFSRQATVSLTRGLWSSAAMALLPADDRLPRVDRTSRELQDEYIRLVYPDGRPASEEPLVGIAAPLRQPRHVLFVILETAPREFYRLSDNASLPTLRAMSQHALVSDRHVTAAPRTDLAIYSMMSGTYPRGGVPLYEFGRFKTDGLATVLGARGYRATYIDSITLRWNVREEALAVNDLGFPTVIEESDVPLAGSDDAFEDVMARERASLSLAHTAMLEAARRGEKALVAVATNFGHYPWRSPASHDGDPSAAKMANLARAFDGAMAGFLEKLNDDGLANDAIIVIVGDHGLRFSVEFDSFGVPIRHGDLMFNVPLMIYSPALFPHTVRLPWVTSHVDLEPTLLDLLGVPRDGLLLHGENMLDGRLAERVTILGSGMFPPMYPVDGLHYRGTFHTWAYAIDRVRSRPSAHQSGDTKRPLSAAHVRAILRDSRHLFNETAAHFLAATAAQP